jgi:hypothetical protein
VRRYLTELRRVLGQRLPEGRAGYQLEDVTTDASRLAELVVGAPADDPVANAQALATGLQLVRGYPFSDRPARSYGWADDGEQLSAVYANQIPAASIALAELALEIGHPNLAGWATRRGALVSPTDEGLNALALEAAALCRPPTVTQAWKEIADRLKLDDEEPSPRLAALYERLRSTG